MERGNRGRGGGTGDRDLEVGGLDDNRPVEAPSVDDNRLPLGVDDSQLLDAPGVDDSRLGRFGAHDVKEGSEGRDDFSPLFDLRRIRRMGSTLVIVRPGKKGLAGSGSSASATRVAMISGTVIAELGEADDMWL